MHGPTRPLVILAVASFYLAVCVGVSIALALMEPVGAIEVALVGARVLTALLALLLATQAVRAIRCLRRLDVEGELHELREQVSEIQTVIEHVSRITTAMIWALIVSLLISAARAVVNGSVVQVVLDLAAAGLLTWLQLRGGGGSGRRKSIGRLLGEKSRALVDQLVETQKGLSPRPSPA